MTSDDKFHVFERITALHEIFGRSANARTLEIYWKALSGLSVAQFDAAFDRASTELKRPASPAEFRDLTRDTRRTEEQRKDRENLCHFHGDGEFENMSRGRPNEPSTNKTVWWCDRCTYFVGFGKQRPDLSSLPGGPATIRQLAESKS